MEKITILMMTLVCALAIRTKRYRTDYEYNHITDSFYKFHPESRRGSIVKRYCEMEGANLMRIENEHDIQQAHGMFKRYPDLPQYAWLASDSQAPEEPDERPIINMFPDVVSSGLGCEVMTREGKIEDYQCFEDLPFICKVKASDIYYNSRCEVYGKDYEYMQAFGSCYKVPQMAYSWNEAYADCRAEGSHLLILNSQAESRAMQNLTRYSAVWGSRYHWFFLAGYRAEPGNGTLVFKTIFNQTLDEAGFNSWSPNEPNNYQSNEFCGSFFRNDGKLNDVQCAHEYGYICEKEVKAN